MSGEGGIVRGEKVKRLSADAVIAALAPVSAQPLFQSDCVYLFGSLARDEAGPLSDVDVAVLFDDDLEAMRRFTLAAAFVEEAERVTGQPINLFILNEAPPALRHRVVRDGRLIYARDERRRIAFETRAVREYLDFQPVLARFDRVLLSRAREGRLGAR